MSRYIVTRTIEIATVVYAPSLEGAQHLAEKMDHHGNLSRWAILEKKGEDSLLCIPDTLDTGEEPHIAVEYDALFWGGDYTECGATFYLPVSAIEQWGTIENAFVMETNFSHRNIISYDESTLYTKDGEFWEDPQEKGSMLQ